MFILPISSECHRAKTEDHDEQTSGCIFNPRRKIIKKCAIKQYRKYLVGPIDPSESLDIHQFAKPCHLGLFSSSCTNSKTSAINEFKIKNII